MKNKLLAVLATFGMVASASAVKINNNLSINGFIDGSWTSTDTNTANEVNDDNDLDIDEVELNFIFNAGNVSGEIHIDDNDDTNELGNIEQAHFSYTFSNGLTAQVGRAGSDLGFEREDPAGLYTYSRAYADGTGHYNIGNVDAPGNVREGVRLSYGTDTISASVAAFNGVGVAEENTAVAATGTSAAIARDTNDLDYEVAVTFTGIENLSLTAGIISLNAADSVANGDIEISNVHATYTLDKLLLGAEYVNVDQDGQDDNSAYMLLADYDINNQLGIAVRYSEWETGLGDSDRISIAPNYALTDSLGAILEYSSSEDANNAEEDTLALELTFTF